MLFSKFNNKFNNKGYSKFTNFILTIAISLLLFVIYNITPFYYYYFELKNQMVALTKVANVNTDLEIREKLFEYVKNLKIPASKDDIVVSRTEKEITISLKYQEIFYITVGKKDYDLYVFNFLANVQNDVPEI